MEQGPESQATSTACSGGVSAVIGSSNIDGFTLVSGHARGNQPYRSLPFRPNHPMLISVCFAREAGARGLASRSANPSGSHRTVLEGLSRTHRTFDLFLQLRAKWQQRRESSTLISRIDTSSNHPTAHQCSDSAKKWIKPFIRPITSPPIAAPITPSSRVHRTRRFPA